MFATLVMRALGPRSRSELFVHTLRVMGPFGVLVAKRELAPRKVDGEGAHVRLSKLST